MTELKIDKEREITFSSKIFTDDDGKLAYKLQINTTGACMSELGLLLASLHVIENHIIEHIEDIEPSMEIIE